MNMTIDDSIIGMTTIINCSSAKYKYTSQGSGFFYSDLSTETTGPTNGNLGWHEVRATWLVTNRHVAFPKIKDATGNPQETTPDYFTFNFREVINGQIEWLPVTISGADLISRTNLHYDSSVDVVAIKIDDLLVSLVTSGKHSSMLSIGPVSNFDMPSNQPLTIEATSDIICCSYPYGFYDSFNKFPIIKSGIIASSWGKNFNGNPTFLIDAKLFPGSSGGLVITKPTDVAMINGNLMKSDAKHFVLLGVYSGEYSRTNRDSSGKVTNEYYGLGIVWYADLIKEIVSNGIKHN